MKVIYKNFDLDFEYLNMHKYFSRFGMDKTLFADVVHLLDEGSDIVANRLFFYLKSFLRQKDE
jgi:hypothetical protein